MREQLDQVRRFNRTVTQRVGALDEAFLGRGRPLGQARLLWEIGPEGSQVRALRSRLELDAGYLSRLLRALERDDLVEVRTGRSDRRVRTAHLTERGGRERAELDRRADAVAAEILDRLDEPRRARLVAAMAEVERLLLASMVRIAPCRPDHPHARRTQAAYFAELAGRFEAGFDPDRSHVAAEPELTPPAGVLLVAALRDQPVGCGAVRFLPGGIAELKRMWVSGQVRGLGVGRRLLTELEARAIAGGAGTVRLETNHTLTEAIAMYRSAGYREVPPFSAEPYAEHWFAKELAGR